MATITAKATPITDTTPVVVDVARELSGSQWCGRYPRSRSIVTLKPEFQLAVSSFLFALEQAGASCEIANTFRPLEACYLMNHAWKIWKGQENPSSVPPMDGVGINWQHKTRDESIAAAYQMCVGYKILSLEDAPALESNHTKGLAIDVSISWTGPLTVKDGNNKIVKIETAPRNNMNQELWKLGASYGVKRYYRPEKDKPHWSVDGR